MFESMKYPILLLVLNIVCPRSFCQQNISGDSLKKYSYTLLPLGNSELTNEGTGFFIQDKKGLYLVTAMHVFCEIDSSSQKVVCPFTFGITYTKSNGFIQFPIPKKNYTLADLNTDVIVIKMDNKWIGLVNTVNHFIVNDFDELGDVTIFGQGVERDASSMSFGSLNNIHLQSQTYRVIKQFTDSRTKHTDSIGSLIVSKDFKASQIYKGFSGSPVFIQKRNANSWELIGVLVSVGNIKTNSETQGYLRAVKLKYAINKINNY